MSAEELAITPPEPAPIGRLEKLGNIKRALQTDFLESDQKLRVATGTALAAGVLAVGAARLPFIGKTAVALEIFQQTNSPVKTGVATAAMFGGWSFTTAKTFNFGLRQYPTVVETIKEDFAPSVNLLTDSLPGLEPNLKEISEHKIEKVKKLGGTALTRTRRGLTALGLGINPYVIASNVQGKSKAAINKLTGSTSVDCGVAAGLLATVMTGTIISVGHENPELAQTIQNEGANTKTLAGTALVLMFGQYVSKRRARKRMA